MPGVDARREPVVLVIRKEQIAAFQESRDRGFIRWMVGYLRDHHEEQVSGMADAEIEERARQGLRRARQLGVREEQVVVDFIALLFLVAPDLYERPAVRRRFAEAAGTAGTPEDVVRALAALSADEWPALLDDWG
jgi:hypothetical protein